MLSALGATFVELVQVFQTLDQGRESGREGEMERENEFGTI